MQYAHDFRAVGYPFRLYSGKNALDKLPDEIARHRASRAFIVCGRTVSRQTPLIRQMSALLGDKLAGSYDEIDKDTTLSSVLRATDAARAAQADLIIGVGAGSVIQGARVVTILLAEKRPLEELITKYPEHGPAISARLMAPKLPIINVLTAPTTAQNRAGSRIKDDATGRGMEFFDPKTRPGAIFWDADALSTAPASLIRTGAATTYCRCVMNLGGLAVNPLVEGNRLQAFRLAAGALPRIGDKADPGPRLELCAATLLQNREADDGGTQFERHWAGRVIYAFSTALFSVFPHVGQGEGTSAVTGTVLRQLGTRDPEAMVRMGKALDVWRDGMPVEEAPLRVADALEEVLCSLGMPTRLSALGIEREGLLRVIEHSLRNFNADPKREFARERELLTRVLEAAW
ncbi:MAG: iron-containing alcohol dehydrogenase family protein [Betaproteobacteria bacterium]|nr:iron-containing alcohol dehydrogenase family protein [Betaproteobacteria bacterium]MDH3435447.1 iron-containing alcohol dehydrogenase family protein [Betaproteobacteria bacterium]